MYLHWMVKKFGWPVLDLDMVEAEVFALIEDICDRKEKWDVDKMNYESRRR